MNNTTDNFFSFMLGDTAYAVPVTAVKEVLPYEKITPVPRTPEYLKRSCKYSWYCNFSNRFSNPLRNSSF